MSELVAKTAEVADQDRRRRIADRRHLLATRRWRMMAPWLMTAVSFVVLLSLAWFLIDNLGWFRRLAFPPSVERDSSFTLYAFHLHLAMVNRSVGLFAGFALIFIGTAVAFYTLGTSTTLEGGSSNWKGRLDTTSPGIIAMVLGTVLIMFTIYSKNSFDALPSA